jgi:hypothetical protein
MKPMSSNSISIAKEVREELEHLIQSVMGEESQTADRVERDLWRGMLRLGRRLLQLFFSVQSEREKKQKQWEEAGKAYDYMGQPTRTYISLFGSVEVKRVYYWRKGVGGKHPLEAALSLPERSYSDCVQELIEGLEVWIPQERCLELIKETFELDIPKRSLQAGSSDHAQYVAAYYEQRAAPPTAEADRILVASADGKGIPMTRQDSPPVQARRGKGEKKTATREATVTAVYSIAPYVRTADDIIRALLSEKQEGEPAKERPQPTGKQVFGTLLGKQAACKHLAQQVAKRDIEQLSERVALTDGSPSLQARMSEHLPDFTLILDIIHATEYLWEAANALLGETNPFREVWIEDALRCLLEDDHETLFMHLEYQIATPSLAQNKVETLTKVLNYLRRNRPYMNYHVYLAQGWPIGTGVVEGTCRHLVKDRFELSGMHWSADGAQVMLGLRAVSLNGDWDNFHRFRRRQAHLARYHTPYPDLSPEAVLLEAAA